MMQPEPINRPLAALVHEVERGSIKIPQFQRDFVWERKACAKLLDSILRGYPIGTFIFWRTRERLRAVRNIGHLDLKPVPDGDYAEQVLDGQQRLTCLYAAARGAVVTRERDGKPRDDNFADMFVDLDAHPDGEADLVVLDPEGAVADGTGDARYARFTDLLNGAFSIFRRLNDARSERYQTFKTALQGYQFPIVMLKEAPLDVATEVFTRINEGGKRLTPFEIMVAKTYLAPGANGKGEFALDREFHALCAKLADVEYETLDANSMLQLIALLVSGECRKKEVLGLDPGRFRAIWPRARDSMELACDYVRGAFGAKAARLLPYSTMLVPFAFYFARREGRMPTAGHARWLSEFFWRVALSGWYSASNETKLAEDCRLVAQLIATGDAEQPAPVAINAQVVEQRGHFSTGRAFIKACLCMLALEGPRSFANGLPVRIENDWLKQANSKNYHHFFPKAFLRKRGTDRGKANHIANITIVDADLNKRQIGAKPPSVYLKVFAQDNPSLPAWLRTHLIDQGRDGVLDDDFERFFQNRCAAIATKLRSFVPVRAIDAQAGVVHDELEDTEEDRENEDDAV